MSRRCDTQLALIAEVAAVCGALGIDCWLRGGWAMDFYLGRVTREHSDVDWLLWAEDADRLVDALDQREYQRTPEHPADQQLDFVWHGEVVSFALLARNDAGEVVVAGGPHAGKAWPASLLAPTPGQIGEIRCRVISPEAQIEIKEMMPVWVPERPRRPKDRDDLALLRRAVAQRSEARGGKRAPRTGERERPDHPGLSRRPRASR
ncbi:MAG: aminoglycoside adenylyltransferase [Candidatus Dormibacteraeota bacterium]|uniref:Aminoglycoside adenylyltransferase n=1 Tax=Candidatus Amunia macphersoniae TaxID=3127014 RepID=A0A934KLS5_9BACT|nr:aminoglycoside adenylyltransferase [Candidatus Dormibacteraeota bacterium]